MYNALSDLWSRFEAEKKHLLQNLKGIEATKGDDVKVCDSVMWYLKKNVPLLSPRNRVGGDIVTLPFVGG